MCGDGLEACPVCFPVDRLTYVDVRQTLPVPIELLADVEHAAKLAELDVAESTKDRYQRAFARFEAWCAGYPGVRLEACPAPPEVIATYVGVLERSRVAWSTVGLALAAIGWEHERRGFVSPTTAPLVKRLRKATRRSLGKAARAPRRALEVAELRALVETCDLQTPRGLRDRALMLLGFAGGFRKSELVGLQLRHLEPHGADIVVRLERSKTDQEGAGRCVGIPFGSDVGFCAVRAVNAWRGSLLDLAGPVFRPITRYGVIKPGPLNSRDVGKVLKKRALLAQLERIDRLGAHSLRHGFITEAKRRGMSTDAIRSHVGHSLLESTRIYLAPLEALSPSNPARAIFCLAS